MYHKIPTQRNFCELALAYVRGAPPPSDHILICDCQVNSASYDKAPWWAHLSLSSDIPFKVGFFSSSFSSSLYSPGRSLLYIDVPANSERWLCLICSNVTELVTWGRRLSDIHQWWEASRGELSISPPVCCELEREWPIFLSFHSLRVSVGTRGSATSIDARSRRLRGDVLLSGIRPTAESSRMVSREKITCIPEATGTIQGRPPKTIKL